MSKEVTMQDIADKLNISKSLVSRALADKYGVSDETRRNIRTTAINMGYKFSTKQQKNIARTDSVTIVLTSDDLLDSGYWVKIINAIERELNNRGISVFLSIVDISDEKATLPLSVRQMKTQGIFILGQITLAHIAAFSISRLPIVLVDHKFSKLKYDHILANNYLGSYEATEYLILCGHKNIGFVGSKEYSFSFSERFRGFCDCMKDNGLGDEKILCTITDHYDNLHIPFSREQFNRVIQSDNHPTALICANDVTAFLCYDLLKEKGLSIPNDVSIVGFDNVPKSEWVTPALTTVKVPKTELGSAAVDMLMKRIKNPAKNVECVLIGTTICKRDSVKYLQGNCMRK